MAVGYPDDMVRDISELTALGSQPATEATLHGYNELRNPDVEIGVGTFPENWTWRTDGGDTAPVWSTDDKFSGTKSMKFVGTGVFTSELRQSDKLTGIANQQVKCSAAIRLAAGASVTFRLKFNFYAADKTTLLSSSYKEIALAAAGNWTNYFHIVDLPDGTHYWQFALEITALDGTFYADSFMAYRPMIIQISGDKRALMFETGDLIIKSQALVAAGDVPVYTVPAGKVFYLVNIFISAWSENAVAGSYASIRNAADVANPIIHLSMPSAIAGQFNSNAQLSSSFPIPIKFNSNVVLELFLSSPNTYTRGTVIGYTVPA